MKAWQIIVLGVNAVVLGYLAVIVFLPKADKGSQKVTIPLEEVQKLPPSPTRGFQISIVNQTTPPEPTATKILESFMPDNDVLYVENNTLWVHVQPKPNRTKIQIGSLDHNGYLRFHPNTSVVMVEVGTNEMPELAYLTRDIGHHYSLLAFEPLPDIFQKLKENIWEKTKPFIFPINAAITPNRGYVPFYISSITGCSSILPLNNQSSTLVQKLYGNMTSKKVQRQLRTAMMCVESQNKIFVPSFPLSSLLKYVSPNYTVQAIHIDAQGFDLVVANTITPEDRKRLHYIVLECQDLALHSPGFLNQGAVNCGYQNYCMREWGFTFLYCWWNSRVSREKNCLYKNKHLSGPVYRPYMNAQKKTYIHRLPKYPRKGKKSWCDLT
eukprot:PhF_6_TR4054/c0_g1_i1/m.5552